MESFGAFPIVFASCDLNVKKATYVDSTDENGKHHNKAGMKRLILKTRR